MTDRSVSWTDAEQLASLLARATVPRRPPPRPMFSGAAGHASTRADRPMPVARAAIGGTPSLPAAPVTPPAPSPPVVAAPPAPAPAPAKAKAEPPPEVPRLEQTSDNPSDRIDALVAWTLDHHRCAGAFLADDNGLTLAAHGISEAHVSLVGPLLSALINVRAVPGIDATAGALWLGAQMMSWVETRTQRGGFCLGTVGGEALSTRAFEQLKEALETTVRGL